MWLSLLCAAAMSGGTALGGRRIIDRMGRDMVALDPCRALSTDLAGALSLWAATLLGLPVSTTHTRTAALLGVGSAGGTSPDWSVARQVARPGCSPSPAAPCWAGRRGGCFWGGYDKTPCSPAHAGEQGV
ncbi:MAG: inorganic phosphate transporter [Lawsonibacter sp.]